jgi:hypothetical protein
MKFLKDLSPVGWVVLIAIVAALGYGVYSIIPKDKLGPNAASAQVSTDEDRPVNGPTVDRTVEAKTSSGRTVEVPLPERPVNGTFKGVVEVGASGFNSFVVNIDPQKRWEIVSKDFGESLSYEGMATTHDIVTGLKKYLAMMFAKGCAGRNVHFVISSGALKNPKTKDISAEIKKMGYTVNEVTADQEGKYALKALLPPFARDNSFTVDMGSGNTKISWYEGSSLRTLEAPGAKYYQNGKTDQEVYEEIKSKVSQVPQAKRVKCYIIGGVPFQMA